MMCSHKVTSWHCCPRWPVASVRAWITSDVIGAESVLPLVNAPEHGAALLFLGVVRDHNEGRSVTGLHYQAYVDMAERTLQEIVAEAAGTVAPSMPSTRAVRPAAVKRPYVPGGTRTSPALPEM